MRAAANSARDSRTEPPTYDVSEPEKSSLLRGCLCCPVAMIEPDEEWYVGYCPEIRGAKRQRELLRVQEISASDARRLTALASCSPPASSSFFPNLPKHITVDRKGRFPLFASGAWHWGEERVGSAGRGSLADCPRNRSRQCSVANHSKRFKNSWALSVPGISSFPQEVGFGCYGGKGDNSKAVVPADTNFDHGHTPTEFPMIGLLERHKIHLTILGNVISLNSGKAHRRNPGTHGDHERRGSRFGSRSTKGGGQAPIWYDCDFSWSHRR